MAKVKEQALSDLEEIMRGVARAFAKNCKNGGGLTERFFMDGLRESGLLRLLEAGQAMRQTYPYTGMPKVSWQCREAWDAALAELRGNCNAKQ